MADAIVSRQQGDDFQARWFWLYAANLLRETSPVRKVSFETGPKAFDDVVVEYAPQGAPLDHQGRPYLRDHMQCKWHVRPGQFGYEDLADPKFSNASSFSLLQRALNAQREYAPSGAGARFQLVTNWDPRDPLRRLISNQTNALDVDRLFKGGPKSAHGLLRARWTEHLNIDEVALRIVLRTMGINVRVRSGAELRTHLNDLFEAVGMRSVPADESSFLYDDLMRKLHGQGRKEFDRTSFRDMVRAEKLLAADAPPPRTVVGVRSFMHPINSIERRAERVLDLVPRFSDRFLREGQDWDGTIYPALRSFVLNEAEKTDRLQLILDTHASLAFAVGAILDVKSGKEVEIEQRSRERRFWSEEDVPIDPAWQKLTFETDRIGDGAELAVAVGITHDVELHVRQHLTEHLSAAGQLLVVRPEGGDSQSAVRSGSHAAQLAESIAVKVRSGGRVPRVHLFIAAPNGLTFFLGRHHRTLGPATIYEWDFEGRRDYGYSPGLTIL